MTNLEKALAEAKPFKSERYAQRPIVGGMLTAKLRNGDIVVLSLFTVEDFLNVQAYLLDWRSVADLPGWRPA